MSCRNRVALMILLSMAAACSRQQQTASTASAETADQFVERLNGEFTTLARELNSTEWTYATYINPDTEFLSAKARERYLAAFTQAVKAAEPYESQQLKPETARALKLLKLSVAAPAPDDAAKRAELSAISSRIEGIYGAGKYCPAGPESCKGQTQLVGILARNRNYDELLDAWRGWHSISRPMRQDYARFVDLANEGARGLGFENVGVMWRSQYDMPADEFNATASRLWEQVKPLYQELHCYARDRLQRKYGEEHVPSGKPIPAHLLGNLWAQQWGEVYDLLEPYPGVSDLDITASLVKQKYDAVRITRSAESFYTSLGFPSLPESFWHRSMLTQPRDRDVQCHASAWHMDARDDVRIKQCILPEQEELMTVYHELGHVFYYLSYRNQPFLFQNGAHDGFHEAIGDTINLSMTPKYLHDVGLVGSVKTSGQAVINQQLKMALDKVAFLPFGKLIDEWRWKVFSGEITPENYNSAWWQLREQYQGVTAPVARTEEDFDPGAKYHIPANVPYTRYFLSYILQFQFHRALCAAAGHTGPLHECSIYGSKEAGEKFIAMLSKGASQPWQDTLFELTGSRAMDASAIQDYFAPLMGWLKEQNAGQQCGW